ncbi:T9SS type A sorting domain-containing protein [Xanthocytophaga flava]|uniref:T9SS type A sorting domain-containing protein n=1 Tax=Xanthocytophaga flava TaxID=3048013 RepID=UPI0028D8306B|nr:T9SS type A sorting domain-containing protein [Xanthocytophaga flavus]MDJ1470289.1 T9SS type A sorting domain-containing protein [Xanthocytophaga flavus]
MKQKKYYRITYLGLIQCILWFLLLSSFRICFAQSSLTVEPSSTTNFYLIERDYRNVYGYYLPETIRNQIGSGFSVDVTFSTVGSNPAEKLLLFGIGMQPSTYSFNNALMVYIYNGQLIVERRVDTPTGHQTFAIPSWNTQMYDYDVPNVRLYFWVNEYAMKMYMFHGETDLTQNDTNRRCELQFYGMNSSLIKSYLTNPRNGILSLVAPSRPGSDGSTFYISRLTISTAKASVTGSPIDANAVQGKEPSAVTARIATGLDCNCQPSDLPSNLAINKPLDINEAQFKNLPTSYPTQPSSGAKTIISDPEKPRMVVMPVPTDDQLTIHLKGIGPCVGKLEILDIYGRVVYQQKIKQESDEKQFSISLKNSGLSYGIYIVRATIEGNTNVVNPLVAKIILN